MKRGETVGNETPRIGGIVGEAAPSRHGVLETGYGRARDCTSAPSGGGIGIPLGERVEREGRGGLEIQARLWAKSRDRCASYPAHLSSRSSP